MAKNLKLKIKNTQLAKAINLGKVKSKIKKGSAEKSTKASAESASKADAKELEESKLSLDQPPPKRRKAKNRSAFAQTEETDTEDSQLTEDIEDEAIVEEEPVIEEAPVSVESSEPELSSEEPELEESPVAELPPTEPPEETTPELNIPATPVDEPVAEIEKKPVVKEEPKQESTDKPAPPRKKKIGEIILRKPKPKVVEEAPKQAAKKPASSQASSGSQEKTFTKGPLTPRKNFKDVKPGRKQVAPRSFDARDRAGLSGADEGGWKRRRPHKRRAPKTEVVPVRPSKLSVRLPISLKDLAVEMKLKAAQLISKLFLDGVIVTLNDYLDDATTVELLGDHFDCKITIDTSEEERIRITDKTVSEEISEASAEDLVLRPPVVAFMGHVDHGKTSLIDAIRKTSRASGEAGAITQHIGAFQYHSESGDITILDTPGHEAFSAMRARGADVTDIVVLVIGGDEGVRQQTVEAIQHAKAAGVTIVVAINKCDKPGFDADNVYRQLADNELLPEAWGGEIITVNCSAITNEGIPALLEMLALQSEVLELRANPKERARGSILESEMHKGMGAVATVLVQNGTLRKGDAIVMGSFWGKVKTMRDELNASVEAAGPSAAIEITGLSGLPEAGEEFITVLDEKEARKIAEARAQEGEQRMMQKKPISVESLLQEAAGTQKKVLNLIVRADVQGSLEAIKAALLKIESDKVEANIILAGVGEIAESDVQLAAASKAMIVGFHTQVESHAESLIRDLAVHISLHDVIYHAVDHVKALMTGMLDKLVEEKDIGSARVQATFKVSRLGSIAGCIVTDGMINRNHRMRVIRDGEIIWKGGIASIKREKEDVREVVKGLECGILLDGFNDAIVDDILEAYEVIEIAQEL
ncbi:Translation initiation factor IF-2 [Chlamydiales bacterium SCGC AG-110-M15]|nr:Translation initiation factor IF-2 [Chlamydiales bacterium SCGC AG-110-M15]